MVSAITSYREVLMVEAEWVKGGPFYGLNLAEAKGVKKILQRTEEVKCGQKYLSEEYLDIGFRL